MTPTAWFGLCGLLVLAFLLLPELAAKAQPQAVGQGKGITFAEYYPAPKETQMKSLLKAGSGKALGPDQYLLTDLVLTTFKITGEGEIVIKAPECLYNQRKGVASSTGALQLESAEGKFSLEGEGFLWQQTNSSLFISNRVQTLVAPELLESGNAAASGQKTNAPGEGIHINSDQFEYLGDNGLGVYRGHPWVSRSNELSMTSGQLTFKLPAGAAGTPAALEAITAEHDVTNDYSGIHATGDKAVYSAQTGLLRLTGHPAWQMEQREGNGDELIIDRTNKVFYANGSARLKMSGQHVGPSAFLPRTDAAVAAQQPASTNQSVEVFSDNYVIRTNLAIFNQNVRMNEFKEEVVSSSMTCSLMTLTFIGTNQLERLVAETNVVIQQGIEQSFTGGKAVYTSADGVLEITQNPRGRSEGREVKGDLLRIDSPHEEMFVQGNSAVKLPAKEIAETAGTVSDAGATNQYADIFSDQCLLRRDSAQFSGGVYVSHPRMNIVSETLTAQLPTPANDAKRILAEQKVVFDLRDEKGKAMHGTGDKVIYTYDVLGLRTNEIVTLDGVPAMVTTTNGVIRNAEIVMDRGNNKVYARGKYSIKLKMGDTNAVPKLQGSILK